MAARARHRRGNGGLIFLTAAVGALLLALLPSGGAAPAPTARPSAAGGAPGARSDAAHEASVRARACHEPVQGLPSLKRVLLLYRGDEGSTAITAGLSSLPGVFNPATGGLDYGGLEPFDKHALRRPGHANITLTDQLAMLRFGLMLPDAPHAVRVPTHAHSNSTETKVVHADDYAWAAAGSRAIVAEVRHPLVFKEATPDEAARLFCGMGVDHIILTLRFSFDRQCAVYVNRNETLYSRLSQFAPRHDESPQPADDIEMGNEQHSIDQLGVDAMVRSHLRIVKANLHLLQALVEGCAHTGTSVHVAVFETSVGIGMENAVARLAHATGLLSAPSASSVHLGEFAGRTPTPYCRAPFLFDAATRQRLRRAGDMAAQGVYEMVRVPANASTPQQLLDAASGFVHSRAARSLLAVKAGTPVAATPSCVAFGCATSTATAAARQP